MSRGEGARLRRPHSSSIHHLLHRRRRADFEMRVALIGSRNRVRTDRQARRGEGCLVACVTVPVPNTAVPFLKVTVPVATPPNAGLIVAVNVTAVPCVDGFFEDTSPVVVAALVTDCVLGADVLVTKFAFPTYTAVIVCVPMVKAFVVKVATPLPFRVPLPITVVPFLKLTVPAGVPPAEATVAVKVTSWCQDDGLTEDVTVVVVPLLFTTCDSAGDVLLA